MLVYFFTLVLEGRIISKVSNFLLFQINWTMFYNALQDN